MSDQTDREPDVARGGPTGPEPRVEWLSVIGDVDVWRSLGLTVTDDGLIPLVGASIRLVPSDDRTVEVGGDEGAGTSAASGTGISGWALSGVPASEHIEQGGHVGHAMLVDGLPTEIVEPATPVYADHPMGASGLDHVVVLTDDLERTSGEIAAASGCELRRIREVGSMRQGFHRIGRGGLIVELVERPDVDPGPASFWGLVLIVEDLDVACDLIGPDRISSPKDAVQPGRRIATVRADVGLGLPLALMSH
jgi:hypothetical protein